MSQIRILTNETNFDQPWAQEAIGEWLQPNFRVAILPLSANEGWSQDAVDWQGLYGGKSEFSYDLSRPFKNYRIPSNRITILNHYEEDPDYLEEQLQRADILFLVGENPTHSMMTIEDLGLLSAIRSFSGIVIGASAGAKIMMQEYYPDIQDDMHFEFQNGIGLVQGFDLETHYQEDPFHISGVIHALEIQNRPVLVLPKKSGAVVVDGQISLFGDAFMADHKDLDELYTLLRSFDQ